MTRKEKIALLIDELEDIRCCDFDANTDEDKTLKEAVRVIKALEQEFVLDKLRAEIDLDTRIQVKHYMTTDAVIDAVLDVIDEYKAESEGV